MYIAPVILTSLVFAGDDWKPRYLSGLPIIHQNTSTINIQSYDIKVSIYFESSDSYQKFSYEKILFLIKKSFLFSERKIEDLGLSKNDCKDDLNIHLVQSSIDTLNSGQFDLWKTINGNNLSTIHGFYDPTINVYRNSVIAFVPHIKASDAIFVHEMAHYWFDRFCIYNQSSIGTETFAKAVERDYISFKSQ
jgi:hypothetical protein